MINPKSKEASFYVAATPHSMDPLHYDWIAHHMTQTSVFAPLVSQYKLGEYTSLLVSKWDSTDDFKQWSFTIKPNLTFDDGTPLNPEAIYKSLARMAFLLKKNNSQDDVFHSIIGFENLHSPDQNIEGLVIDGPKLIFKFSKPIKGLLDLLSFGLYGIVNPKDFNEKTGEWINPHVASSSGLYSLEKWSDSSLTLHLRKEIASSFGHPKKFEKIVIKWSPGDYAMTDILAGFSSSEGLSNYSFKGPVASNMAYIHVLSWKNAQGPMYDKKVRVELRNAFYQELEKIHFKYTTSFFPFAIKGVKGPVIQKSSLNENENFFQGSHELNLALPAENNPYRKLITTVFPLMASKLNLKLNASERDPKKHKQDRSSNGGKTHYDLSCAFSGILTSNPSSDVRFMFLSKDGIQLPDPTGKIHKMLEAENFDIQQINQQLVDDAIIWPYVHFSFGIWVKDDIDTSLLNHILPPIDFSWIGSK